MCKWHLIKEKKNPSQLSLILNLLVLKMRKFCVCVFFLSLFVYFERELMCALANWVGTERGRENLKQALAVSLGARCRTQTHGS